MWFLLLLPWIVYYGDEAPVEAFEPYNPIVLQGEGHPPLDPLLEEKKDVLGYLDLTEASENDPWYLSLKVKGLLLKENPDWKGDWLVDIRSPVWKKIVLEKMIPSLFSQGFTGLMIDQVDLAIASGMKEAAIDLIQTIHQKFPDKRLMLNRGYEILPNIGGMIHDVLAETLYSEYDFKAKRYFVRTKAEYEWGLAQLERARKLFPHLIFFSLDYWDPSDTKKIKEIYDIERKNGLRPYVTTVTLDQITPEPSE